MLTDKENTYVLRFREVIGGGEGRKFADMRGKDIAAVLEIHRKTAGGGN